MAKKKSKQTEAIQSLLAEKQQTQQWLNRLDMAADKTPEGVRSKVRGDYQKRLDAILEELKGYRDDLEAALTEQREAREALAQQESAQAEQLAEAELRHTVGEYDEGKWSEVKTEILEGLLEVRERLKDADAEIERLEEVLATIEGDEGKAPPAQEPVEEAAAVPEVEEELPVPDVADEEVPDVAAEEEIPEPELEAEEEPVAGKRPSEQTDAFDELAFLRSVTEDETQGPQAARASGAQRLSSQDLVSPVEELQPDDVAGETAEDEVEVGAEGVEAVDSGTDRPSQGTDEKTVKCGECGAMNLPTEWYCERCGAELAAL
jgi:hypothetical protein